MEQPKDVAHTQRIGKTEEHSSQFSTAAQQALPLLMTRVHVPPLPAKTVERPQLIELLDKSARQHKLTLLQAPAGFGKTTLLSSWCAATANSGMASAWISLDERDNDPKHFLAYLLFALQNMQFVEDFQQFFPPAPLEPFSEEMLIRLLNVITASIQYDFVLILDDYHYITNPLIHRALRFLLKYSPQSMHFVIASRSQPPLALTKLRAHGQLLELNSQDLRFCQEETKVFFNETMDLDLQEREIEELSQRIEGWITGLQLAAYTLQKGKRTEDLLQTFSRNRRYILDYLATEVFRQQSQELQELLLHTSILERFNASLCAAITNRSDDQDIGKLLEQNDLFLIPLEEDGWYRYDHLFRDFLSHMLVSQHPEQIPTLNQRASIWFEQHGDFPSAIEHALAAHAFSRAIDLILQVIQSLLDQCQVALLLKWLFTLPDELILERPVLCLVYAWALVFSGITTNVEAFLYKVRLPPADEESGQQATDNVVEAYLHTAQFLPRDEETGEQQTPDAAAWHTLLAAIRSYLANCRGDIQQALEASHYALQHLPRVDRHMRALAILGAGSAFWLDGQEAASIPLFKQVYAENVTANALPIAFTAAWALSKIYVTQGYLHKALQCLQQALDYAEQKGVTAHVDLHPATGMLYVGIGDIFRRWHNVDLANHYLIKGLELCQHWEATGIAGMALIDGAISLARMRFLQEEKENALEFIALAEYAIQHYNMHFYIPLLFRLFKKGLRLGNDPHLSHFILDKVAKTSYIYELDQLIEVQFALEVSDFERALELLSPLQKLVNTTKRLISKVDISLFQALAYYGKSQITRAIQILSQALAEGSKEYHLWLFIEKGKPLATLLERTLEARQQGNVPGLVDFPLDFATNILATFKTAEPGQHHTEPSSTPLKTPGLIEPLSARELDVLRLAVQGHANQEIAQQLGLALCTIRWHLKNIYGKLQVHNRVQLALQAQKLGL